jgi:hypothetical protein
MNLATRSLSQPSPVVPWQFEHEHLSLEFLRCLDRIYEALIGQFASVLSLSAMSLAFFDQSRQEKFLCR